METQIFRAKDAKTHQNRFSQLASGSYGRVHHCFIEADHTKASRTKAVKLLRLSGSEEVLRNQENMMADLANSDLEILWLLNRTTP